MERKYYHITPIENVFSILQKGLVANTDGDIYLFENKSIKIPTRDNPQGKIFFIADLIAQNQLNLKRYAMFEIDSKGIEVELIKDDVAEFTASYQWIAKQKRINRRYINLFGDYNVEI